jgi:hypothetical protein
MKATNFIALLPELRNEPQNIKENCEIVAKRLKSIIPTKNIPKLLK